MTLLLGLGDSFHLVPRIIANVESNGFKLNSFGLFLGTRVSAITMSIFYLLFYFYIKKKINSKDKALDFSIIILFALRLLFVILSFNQSEKMDLISNVPFVLMGLIDIFLLYNNKNKEEFKNLYIYVFFSFLFYVPVVLFKKVNPSIGILMMPKTIMYVLIVIKLYRNLKKDFVKKDIMEFSVSYLFSGTHLIDLGFVLPAIFYLLVKKLDISNEKLEKLFRIYNFGIYFSFTTMFLHGLVDGYSPLNIVKIGMISVSGIGHILITLAVILISLKCLRAKETLRA